MQLFTHIYQLKLIPPTGFNKHFVSYKLDMERGEGPALGKKYGVKAFPTMLFMDAEGNVRHTIVGSKSANELIEEAKTALKK